MIGPDLRVEGFDAESWTHLVGIFMPNLEDRLSREPPSSDADVSLDPDDGGRARGTLILVDDAERRILMARHSMEGTLPGLVGESSARDLRDLTAAQGARRVVVIREGALDGLADALADGLAHEPPSARSGYVTQWLVLLRAVRQMVEHGELRVWPNPLASVPVPSNRMVQRTFDQVLPDDRALVVALFDRDEPYTSLVVRRRHGLIDLVAGPDLITTWTGPLGGDWRRDHRILNRAVERHVAPVHLGLFAEVDAVREALRSGEPGEWARQVTVRDMVIDPMPRSVKVALGADAIRGLSHITSDLLGGFDLVRAAGPVLDRVRSRWTEIRSLSEELGFDPFIVLAALLRRDDD
ncbi:MAG: hypothetical protein CMN30_34165 [Sandaracinus sp.]|mgnify:CR=1 FL=1|nr:hypothetical protein [Sandaracinus sp.]